MAEPAATTDNQMAGLSAHLTPRIAGGSNVANFGIRGRFWEAKIKLTQTGGIEGSPTASNDKITVDLEFLHNTGPHKSDVKNVSNTFGPTLLGLGGVTFDFSKRPNKHPKGHRDEYPRFKIITLGTPDDIQSWTFDFKATHIVPIPAALPLFGTGLAVLGFMGWRRKRQAAA